MGTIQRIRNEGYPSELPYMLIGDLLIRPTDGPRWSSEDGCDIYMPVSVQKGDGTHYLIATLHTEIDCDGMFLSAWLDNEVETEIRCDENYATASFEDAATLFSYLTHENRE